MNISSFPQVKRNPRTLLLRAIAYIGLYDLALRLRLAIQRPLPFGRYRSELRFYRGLIRPGSLCFDVGANLGLKTSLFLDAGARVIAIEPQPACVDVLRRDYGHRSGVTVVASAVGAAEGEAELFLCDQSSTTSSMSRRFISGGRFAETSTWRRKIIVPTTTLDALISEYGVPDYCKIDVEGYEANVLAGLSHPLPLISFEFSREFMDDARACASRLEAIGLSRFDCALNHSSRMLVGEWVSADALFARLVALDDPLLVGEVYARSDAPP
jgi:FkbM family methyltransferase